MYLIPKDESILKGFQNIQIFEKNINKINKVNKSINHKFEKIISNINYWNLLITFRKSKKEYSIIFKIIMYDDECYQFNDDTFKEEKQFYSIVNSFLLFN